MVINMSKIRLGIIGSGLAWRILHYPALKELVDCYEIKAICIRDKSKWDEYKKELENTKIYADYHELLQDVDVDAVLVATPIELNGIITMEALKNGKHVFSEKPLAIAAKEASDIIDLSEKMGKKVFMLEQLFYLPYMKELKSLIENKTLGNLVYFEKTNHSYSDLKTDKNNPFLNKEWRQNPKYPLGGIFDGGVHDISVINYLFGTPKKIFAIGKKMREEMGAYDHILTTMNFNNGFSGVFSHSDFLPSGGNNFILHFEKAVVTVVGNGYEIQRVNQEIEKVNFTARTLHKKMWSELFDDFTQNRESEFSLSLGLTSLKILESIEESLKSGMPSLL